jgi:hypothetical protein
MHSTSWLKTLSLFYNFWQPQHALVPTLHAFELVWSPDSSGWCQTSPYAPHPSPLTIMHFESHCLSPAYT